MLPCRVMAADNSAGGSSVINGAPRGFAAGAAASTSTVLQALRSVMPGESTTVPACCVVGGSYGYANHCALHEGGNKGTIPRRDNAGDGTGDGVGVGSCEIRRGDKGLLDAGFS